MAAEKPFDPYHLWLGIAPADQPPNHYRLLGTGLFERDDEVIEQAAERQSAHIRTFLSTPQAAQAKSLLNKIRLATDCLHSPDLKARYDAALKTQLARRAETAAEDSAALDLPPAEAKPSAAKIASLPAATNDLHVAEFAPNLQQSSRRRKPVRRSTTPWTLIIGGVLAGVLALGGAAAWLNRSAPPEKTNADQPATAVARDSKTSPASSPPTSVEPEPKKARPIPAVATNEVATDSGREQVNTPAATALEFDGQTQHVTLGNPPELNLTGQITLSAWVRPQETEGIHNIVVHGYCHDPEAEVFLRTNDGRYEAGSWNGKTHHADCAMPPADVGAWVHLTATYDGKQWKLFRNGAVAGEKADELGAIPVNDNWAIAATGDGKDRFFHGGLADVRIYRRGLADDEVRELFSRSPGAAPGDDDKLSEGLVASWPLDDASDPIVDHSAGGHDGKLVGGPRTIAGPHDKPSGSTKLAKATPPATALEFDGQTQYVALGNPRELNFAGQITLSAWIKPADVSSADYQEIVGHDFSGAPPAAVYLRMFQGQYQVGSWDSMNYFAAAAIPASDLNQWVQLTGVYDGTRWKLFRNGLLLAEKSDEHGAVLVNERWTIGAIANGKERFFHGGLADVRVYRRGLSDDEVQELFSRPASATPGDDDRLSEGLVGSWPLDSASGTVVDRSGGGHKGKLVGRPRAIAGPHGELSGTGQLAKTEPGVTISKVAPPAVNAPATVPPVVPPANPAPTGVPKTQEPNPGPAVNTTAPSVGVESGADFTLVKQLTTGGRVTAFSPDGQWVASGGNGNPELLELHNVRTGKKTALINEQHAFIRDLAFTRNSRQLAVVDAGGVVKFWDVASGGLARTVPAPALYLDGQHFGSDARTVVLICVHPTRAGVIADTQSGAELFRVRSPLQHLLLALASPNGRYLLLGSNEINNGVAGPERMTLHDLKADRESGSLPDSPPGDFWRVAFSPDSSRIALSTRGKSERVTIWNVAGRRVERELLLKLPTGALSGVSAMTFTNDGRHLLTFGFDRNFGLWDVSSGELLAFLRGDKQYLFTFLGFAADGRTFCAANEWKIAQVWQMRVSMPKVAAPAAQLTPPDRDQQAALLKLVKEAFSGEFSKAKKPADKAELARKLLTRASEAANANERYVILEQARDLAAQAGEAALLCQAIDIITTTYTVDPLSSATAGLELLPRSGTVTNQGELAEALAALAERWAERGDLDAASKLAVQAAAAARKAKNAELSKSLARSQAGWKEAARGAEALRTDQATLSANPDDPAANLSVGKHYGRLDDWDRALPLLAKGADESLQRLAADELKTGDDPQERLRLADAWYEFASAQPRKEQPLFLSRAAALYRQAAPGLKGLLHTKAQKRIDDIEAAGE